MPKYSDHRVYAALLTLTALLGGCASPVVQSRLDTGDGQPGLVYALPKAQILLQASRKLVDADLVAEAKKQADDSAAEAKTAATTLETETAALTGLEARVEAAPASAAGPEAMAELKKQRDIAKIVVALATQDVKTTKAAAVKADAAYRTVFGEVGKWVETASISQLAHAPDPKWRFVAQHQASGWRDDQLSLSVAGGLLSTTQSQSTGQAANIALSLAQAVGAFSSPVRLKSNRLNFRLQSKTSARTPVDCKAYDFVQVFDPSEAEVFSQLNRKLADVGSALQLSLIGQAGWEAKKEPQPPHEAEGLLYRAPLSLTLEIAPEPSRAQGTCPPERSAGAARLTVTVPDSSRLYRLPIAGAALTKTSVKHVFKDGMLTELSLDQPSGVVAIASLPVDILKALMSIPAELIKLKVDYSSQQTAQTEQQAKLIEAQLKLLKLQAELQAAQNTADLP